MGGDTVPIAVAVALVAEEDRDRLLALLDAGVSPATRRAYASSLRGWRAWCEGRGLPSFPATPEAVALWIADSVDRLAVSSIRRHLAALVVAHRAAGHASPVEAPIVRAALRGAARAQAGHRCRKEARPFRLPELRAVIGACPATVTGSRDRALILLGVAGGFRRSELAALDVGNLARVEEGIEVRIGTSKTDQEGQGAIVPILPGEGLDTCPVRAVLAWIEGADKADPLFPRIDKWGGIGDRMSDRGIAEVIKRAALRAGIDPGISGHSLRATFATIAARQGAAERDIARVGRWASILTLRRYIRSADRWRDHPLRGSGL